ncbi:DUF167 family protein [Pseudomonas abyssi]|uniref:UPF0235 protein ASB58_17800 n=1 Tax=Pseudomonas abyssi TaxID=170540 RepID=A0A395QYA8_9PSED|nr:DUF167 family protein [Halopseudomonas gallaeciensis]RGP52868.1 hypothetical protein ASB58_17800 [Halopseudomonas gallaeciensis]
MSFYHWQDDDLLLDCHLQPGAKRAEFAGQHGERLKIRISAPPVDGKANDALIRFLADAFAVSRQQVSLLSGQNSRQKRLRIQTPRQLPAELGIQRR